MSYPYIGMPGIIPPDEKWDAANIEKLLREGKHIYFEDQEGVIGVAQFAVDEFQFISWPQPQEEEYVAYSNASFLEFAVYCAFMGRDFL